MKKCLIHLAAFAAVSATAWSNAAYADSETDRLREALRSATAQTRQLEDQRVKREQGLKERMETLAKIRTIAAPGYSRWLIPPAAWDKYRSLFPTRIPQLW